MRSAREAIEARIALYRAKQAKHDPLADDTLTEWEKIQFGIEVLQHLASDLELGLSDEANAE